MTREEPKLVILPLLFYVIFRRKSSEWLESSIESDLFCDLQYGALTLLFSILLSSNYIVSCVRTGCYIEYLTCLFS